MTPGGSPTGTHRNTALDGYALLIGGLIVLNLWRILHHAPWGDEWHAWLVATESPDLAALFRQIRHEGHPALWYLLLRPLGALTRDPVAMQLVHWLIGALIYLVIGFASPFSRLERVLILLSYFLFFEYIVPSRGYGLGALALLGFAWVRQHRPAATILPWLFLGLAANTNAFAAIAAVSLGVSWFVMNAADSWRRHVAGMIAFIACLAVAALSAVPPQEQVATMVSHKAEEPSGIESAPIKTIAKATARTTTNAFLPIEDEFPARFWNPSLGPPWLRALLSIPILVIIARILSRERELLLAFGVCLIGLVAFAAIISDGQARHHGILFVIFVVALWMLRVRGRPLPRLALLLLVLNALGGLQAVVGERLGPFSRADDAAAWIEAEGHADAFWIAAPHLKGASVAGRLGRSFYLLECMCTTPFVSVGTRRRIREQDEVSQRVADALRAVGRKEAFLLLAGGLADAIGPGADDPNLQVELLARFDGAEVGLSENYAVYRVAWRQAGLPRQ